MKSYDNTQSPYEGALRALRGSFVQAGLFSAAINLLMLTGPLYMLQIYDRVLASGSVPTLMGLFLIVVVLYAFMGVYEFIRSRLLSRAAYRFDEMTGELAFRQLLESDNQNGKGGNALRDLEIVRGFLSGPAIRGLFDVPWIPIFLVAVFIIHPWLGYMTLAGAAVVVALALLTQWLTGSAMSQAMRLDGVERAFVSQSLRNAETVQALGMREAVAARWRSAHEAGLTQSQKGGDRSDMVSSGSRVFRLVLQSMLLTGGAYLALQQQISAGMIVGASILAGRALAPVDQVIGQWRSIGRAAEAHKRLTEVFEAAPAKKPRISLPEPAGAVRLFGVTKLMPGGLQHGRSRILDQVSFELEPGDVLGVIGNSAAGKSSLARMLVGVWRPDAGEVRLDGATLDQWEPDELGRYIGYLPQHVEMLPGTIAENIARFDPDAREKDIFQAADAAGVHDMILGLPDGYATQVGHAAQPLSGGQIQRIGLARAIYKMPKLVVLDEPNAHLDAHGDESLTETIRSLREAGSTVVVMAHRPSVLVESSKVLILHKGKVAQFGRREEIFRLAMQSVPTQAAPAVAARKAG
ncbi:type I secretion system permease/ATPase [Ruegeria sediminis]|uniref:Type I secretion system permease/ATPase n=1 Tax=Ruegeria sediminis TaxID=2583820 RepID=A0ABY2WXL2_9RHOB|nr:type I secretion system permease/ATPase [Ruegeria sediminis]TMV07245.1 type I secretion system permease/ATPase [Ruegeria sediminis]